jgi:hypothetical protein
MRNVFAEPDVDPLLLEFVRLFASWFSREELNREYMKSAMSDDLWEVVEPIVFPPKRKAKASDAVRVIDVSSRTNADKAAE